MNEGVLRGRYCYAIVDCGLWISISIWISIWIWIWIVDFDFDLDLDFGLSYPLGRRIGDCLRDWSVIGYVLRGCPGVR